MIERELAKQFCIDFLKTVIAEDKKFCEFFLHNENRSRCNFHNWVETCWKNFTDMEVYCSAGLTRGVFIFPELGYVIKLPFFTKSHDYGAIERENYLAAEYNNVSEFFAWCDELVSFTREDSEDIVVTYIQEYAECGDKLFDRMSYFSSELMEDYMCESIDDVEVDCVEDFLCEVWGEENYCAFNDFCCERDICDIHGGNIGYIDGQGYVVVDYAGYKGM